ncbi:MAG TPA: ABC transporter permease [Lacunisphaera sp.]|jgi:predicted permease|nr:ABC transporter permease [Lacunisphaera sp.]
MFLETFLQDLRIGLRVLIKEKSFCALAVLVLALGICAVTTQFSIVNGVVLRGFSFPNAARLMSINFIDPTQKTAFGTAGQVSAMDYVDLAAAQKSFEHVASYINGATVNVTIGSIPKRFTGAYISEHWLKILGVSPALGRDFTADDDRAGAAKVALISYNLWQREFAGAANVVGTGVVINGKPATIVGVMPKGFSFPTNEEIWIPLNSEFPPLPRNNPRAIGGAVVGLLQPGVTVRQAELEMDAIAKRLAAAYPDTNKQFNTAQVEPLRKTFTPTFLLSLMLGMLAICLLVLLIACLNVMNMQFARATLRAKELAIRSSLGATRVRLIRQMLTESILLAAIGAVLGVAGSYWAIDFLTAVVANLPFPPPSWITFDIDIKVLAFTVAATVGAAVVSGLVPAWMSSRANAADALKEGGRGNTSRTINFITRGLVVTQIVVTSLILVISLLLGRAMRAQQNLDYGYDKEGVITARMGLMDGAYPTQQDRLNFYRRLLVQLRSSPQFANAALTSRFRMTFVFNGPGALPIEIEGKEYKTDKDRPNTNLEQISEGYFQALGAKILEGRDFNDDDTDQKLPVAIVNAAFAKKHFGGQSAIGRRFRTVANNGTLFGPWRTIVGVCSDLRMTGPFNNTNVDSTGFYLPFASSLTGPVPNEPAVSQFATVIAKPPGGQRATVLAENLRREVAKVDGNLPLYFIETPAAGQDSFIAQNKIVAIMVAIFGVVAIILAAVGLYGVMSFSVNQRSQEFGVRMALGADAGRILGMVLQQGGFQIGLGLAIGLGATYLAASLASGTLLNFFYPVSPTDALSYVAVGTLVAVISLFAALFPARRATRVDPMVALRAE